MNKERLKYQNLNNRVWCADCINKEQPVIKKADFLIPVRSHHYDLSVDGFTIDQRMIGVCKNCLKHKNEFQKGNAEAAS